MPASRRIRHCACIETDCHIALHSQLYDFELTSENDAPAFASVSLTIFILIHNTSELILRLDLSARFSNKRTKSFLFGFSEKLPPGLRSLLKPLQLPLLIARAAVLIDLDVSSVIA